MLKVYTRKCKFLRYRRLEVDLNYARKGMMRRSNSVVAVIYQAKVSYNLAFVCILQNGLSYF